MQHAGPTQGGMGWLFGLLHVGSVSELCVEAGRMYEGGMAV